MAVLANAGVRGVGVVEGVVQALRTSCGGGGGEWGRWRRGAGGAEEGGRYVGVVGIRGRGGGGAATAGLGGEALAELEFSPEGRRRVT